MDESSHSRQTTVDELRQNGAINAQSRFDVWSPVARWRAPTAGYPMRWLWIAHNLGPSSGAPEERARSRVKARPWRRRSADRAVAAPRLRLRLRLRPRVRSVMHWCSGRRFRLTASGSKAPSLGALAEKVPRRGRQSARRAALAVRWARHAIDERSTPLRGTERDEMCQVIITLMEKGNIEGLLLDQAPHHLSDHALLARVQELVRCDRQVTAEIVAHLAEVDARQLYLEQACSISLG